ncbi:hypothetical protein GIB67_001130 [Kingdonia uniflora]|uniref:Cytochrome P450 n=1 Tax=Kingdonia uniflora TaxID=39325 RepID=A0A7J7MHJ4_9MAGN|nr:hypothetical protein GIB67_001130 [Kingdonia uniflora]
MGKTLVVSLIICALSVILWAMKALYTIWWTPKKLERALRKQGIKGPAYKLFFGNMKENFGMVKEARSKSMNLSHNIAPHILPFALQTVEKYAFGSSFEEGRRIFQLQTEQAELAIQAIQSVYIPGSRFLPTKRNTRMKEIDKEVRVLLTDIIHKREQATKVGESTNGDLLGLMMESNFKEIKENNGSKKLGMSLHEIIEECKLFYFAGQETTSTLLVWTMVALSMHPEWQVLAREEVLQIFEQRAPEFDELTHLKIVPMILYEVLRLYPPLVLLTRRTDKEMKLGKIILPAGVRVALPILFIHHDREIWGEDVDQFNPERFRKGVSNATKNQVSFFPFGWGPRICIGQDFAMVEAKMALTMILQHFSFKLSPTYAHAPCTVITIQPQYGAQIILRKI